MISLKKSYARQLLQLALTLSLLRVDPEHYLGWGWESQLALQDGDGWQLELRGAPLTDHSYSNRKALIPLIEDLVRFDRQRNVTSYDVQTYLLNVQNEQMTAMASSSPPAPPSTSTSAAASVAAALTSQPETNATISYIAPTIVQMQNATRNMTEFTVPIGSDLADLFLNADVFTESTSVFDQNLADLNDYEGQNNAVDDPFANFNTLYAGLPLKDEPSEILGGDRLVNLRFNEAEQAASTSGGDFGSYPFNHNEHDAFLRRPDSPRLNYTKVIEWSTYFNNRTAEEENFNDDDHLRGADRTDPGENKTGDDNEAANEVTIKTEPVEEGDTAEGASNSDNRRHDSGMNSEFDEDSDGRSSHSDSKNSTSGFSSNAELKEEESEIVEVLWKQDVDLGYTLAPAKAASSKEATVNSSGTVLNTDETEKLKALRDLKEEKAKDDSPKNALNDEWAGIQFTVDNETGEYIQLPQLDEILQDVLQLADLDSNNDERVGKILSESLEKYGHRSATSNFEEDSASGELPSASSLLLDPPLTDEEISANLEELDMMIQSAGPFQHPRAVGQNYAHGANSYHRQPAYHPQSRMSLGRTVSMEHLRLQGIANIFNNPLPGMGDMSSYYPSHYSYQGTGPIAQHEQFPHSQMALHNASLAELGAAQSSFPPNSQQSLYTPNLGTAVSSSMHLTNTSHESDVGAAAYKMDHDLMYYPNTTSELNHTSDGFINSILNDEDLMQFGSEEGFYTMRMLESNTASNNSTVLGAGPISLPNNGLLPSAMSGNVTGLATGITGTMGATGDRLDASSDSAVSSMGSERVPSLSDGEWGDGGSDSAQEYHQSKYGPYDYSYSSRLGDSVRHPVAQKKHQMFGKRFFQDQSSVPNSPQLPGVPLVPQQPDIPIKYEYEPYAMHHPSMTHNVDGSIGTVNKHHAQQHQLSQQADVKFSCSLDFARQNRGMHDIVSHNHTYTMPQSTGATPRPQARDKKLAKKIEDEHLTRDEKRARALNIPMPVSDVINLPMDEFNERLSKYELSENQLSLIRDIRRRGKNKVAAQNCRKRKLDQINSLADEVKEVRRRREMLEADSLSAYTEHARIKAKFNALYKHIFENLRDEHGNLYSQDEFNLQQSADGRVHLLPRERNPANTGMPADPRGSQQSNHLQQSRHQPHSSNTHPNSHHNNHHHNGHHPHHHQH